MRIEKVEVDIHEALLARGELIAPVIRKRGARGTYAFAGVLAVRVKLRVSCERLAFRHGRAARMMRRRDKSDVKRRAQRGERDHLAPTSARVSLRLLRRALFITFYHRHPGPVPRGIARDISPYRS